MHLNTKSVAKLHAYRFLVNSGSAIAKSLGFPAKETPCPMHACMPCAAVCFMNNGTACMSILNDDSYTCNPHVTLSALAFLLFSILIFEGKTHCG